MSEQAALLNAIIAHPDDDTPRLVYADWLDEHAPDKTPSPAAGPSARAEYIRVQCRLAHWPFDDPDYPELLEREEDLAEWLRAHQEDAAWPALPEEFRWYGDYDSGDDGNYRRGFAEEIEYSDYEDDPGENVRRIVGALPRAFEANTVRTLRLEDAYGDEVAGLVRDPAAARLRGLAVVDVADETAAEAVRALAESSHLGGLRWLELDASFDGDKLKRLARAKSLDGIDSLRLVYPSSAGLRALAGARWFRNLRSLHVWGDRRDVFGTVARLPPMPNLAELVIDGDARSPAALREFAAPKSFPRLGRLELLNARLGPEHAALLARGRWPLRHLRLANCDLRRTGAEALAGAAFAESLRVLELGECQLTSGGARALAASAKLAGLRHLNLARNPVGPGGLAALARGEYLRGLRKLSLADCNDPKAPLSAADVLKFLQALDAPELRHLKLARLPVGARGARVIAAGGPFANLTRLELAGCGLRENGARAIVESGALPHLMSLDLSDNAAGKGVSKLANAKVHPRLGSFNVAGNRLTAPVQARLRERPGVRL